MTSPLMPSEFPGTVSPPPHRQSRPSDPLGSLRKVSWLPSANLLALATRGKRPLPNMWNGF
jgi:hypothetical protein